MTIRRAVKPAPRPYPEAERSYGADTVFGLCENPQCGRHARTTCSRCGGEYCLWHDRHPLHDMSATAR